MEKKVLSSSAILFIMIFFISLAMTLIMNLNGVVEAFDQVTAQEAYNMVSSGEAALLDVRTLEEYIFVGSPALDASGEPIAYLVSWKLSGGIDDNGQIIYRDNPDFDALVEQTFGSSKDHALIVMCAVGVRSTSAANRLEQIGFTRVYEIDNKLKELASPPGGCGGFQGSNYQAETRGYYWGYRGYPGRLPNASAPSSIKVATVTDQIENENDSVSWMDTGLPITQKVDPQKIPKLKKAEPPVNENKDSFSGSQSVFPSLYSAFSSSYVGYQAMTSYLLQPTTYSIQGTGHSPPVPQQNWMLPEQAFMQSLYQGSYVVYPWQSQSTAPTGFTDSSSIYNPRPKSS